MKTLTEIFADALAIWGRNYALMYVMLFFTLLMVLIWPERELPAWEPRWILLGALVVLLQSAFYAGWFHMISVACQRYFNEQKNQPVDFRVTLEAARLFGEFLPGVGRYFPAFVVGTLIKAGVIFLLYLGLQDLLAVNMPVIQKLGKLPLEQQQNALNALSGTEIRNLSALSLGLMAAAAVYGIYFLLTMFWPAFVTLYQENVLRAFWRSIGRFFQDPLRILAIGLFFFSLQLILFFVMATGVPGFMIGQFASLMLGIFTAILLFVYLLATVGKPAPDPARSEDLPEPADDARHNP